MSFRAAAITFALVILLAPMAQAAELSCAPGFSDDGKQYDLVRASIFDGPEQDKADLKPDDSGKWNLADYRRKDRDLFLICYYGKGEIKSMLMIPQTATVCKKMDKNAVCR